MRVGDALSSISRTSYTERRDGNGYSNSSPGKEWKNRYVNGRGKESHVQLFADHEVGTRMNVVKEGPSEDM